jgi:hypothetical protein
VVVFGQLSDEELLFPAEDNPVDIYSRNTSLGTSQEPCFTGVPLGKNLRFAGYPLLHIFEKP